MCSFEVRCAVPLSLSLTASGVRCCVAALYVLQTNPFELVALNEHFYGRGTSDNKVGQWGGGE